MEPEFTLEPNFVPFGIDYLEPLKSYQTPDRKLLRIEWRPGEFTYYLPEHHNIVSFKTLAAAFHAAYGKEMT